MQSIDCRIGLDTEERDAAMSPQTPVSPELQDLIDREQIRQCMTRYTRGIDRLDPDLIRTAFHPDAIDIHSKEHGGSPQDFLDWWVPTQARREVSQHYVTNYAIDIEGDTAHVESYWFMPVKMKDQDKAWLVGGRYNDRVERRNGAWKIALRLVHIEWTLDCQATRLPGFTDLGIGARNRSDPSYQRPLQVPPAFRELIGGA